MYDNIYSITNCTPYKRDFLYFLLLDLYATLFSTNPVNVAMLEPIEFREIRV